MDIELFKKDLKEVLVKHQCSLYMDIQTDLYGITERHFVVTHEDRGVKLKEDSVILMEGDL